MMLLSILHGVGQFMIYGAVQSCDQLGQVTGVPRILESIKLSIEYQIEY